MECYYCGALLTKADYCPECGENVALLKKIIRLSNHYYNMGLEKASVRDLSGAIVYLKRSLKCNKANVNARNLLGLVYFEMGESVMALGEWVISKNVRDKQNLANDYLNAIQNNQNKLDTINQTIKKYNQALLYCRQNSEDMAIIQLKKVLSMNQKLVKGYQLLGLLYIEKKEWERAKKTLNAALKIDANNTMTLRYLKEVKEYLPDKKSTDIIGQSKSKKQQDKIERNNSRAMGNDAYYHRDLTKTISLKDNTAIFIAMNILVGMILGGLVVGFLIRPELNQSSVSETKNALLAANEQLAEKNATISDLEKEIENAQSEVDSAKSSVNDSATAISSYEQMITGLNTFYTNDLEAASTAFSSVNRDSLSDAAKATYDTITTEINNKLLGTWYTDGYNAYQQYDYETTVTKLEKVVAVQEDYEDGNALYYLAQAYRKTEQVDKAKETYQKVIALIPGTQRATNSQEYLTQLETGNTADTAADQ